MYHVRYVERCESKIKSFKSKLFAMNFVAEFTLKYQGINTDDNWIDSIYQGEHLFLERSIEVNYGPTGKKTDTVSK